MLLTLLGRVNLPLRRLVATFSLVIVDQGLFSTTNFLSMLLLARWMSPAVFGVFSTIQLLAMFAGACYSSLLMEPMSVLGASVFASSPAAYERALRVVQICLGLGIGILALPILWLTLGSRTQDLPEIAVAFALLLPLFFAAPFARRHCYNKRRVGSAAGISCGYFLILLATLFVLDRSTLLSSITAWSAMAGCSVVAASTTLVAMGRRGGRQEAALPASRVIREHWGFGRWDLLGSAIFAAAQQLPILAMTRWFGLGNAGAFRALALLAMPMLLLTTSTSSAVLPVIASVEARGDRTRAALMAFGAGAGLSSLAAAYLLAAYVFADPLLDLVYGQKYHGDGWLVPLLALQVLLYAATVGCDLHMRAALWPKFLAIYSPAVLAASLASTIFLVHSMGLAGAVYAIVVMNAVGAFVKLAIYGWWRQHRRGLQPSLS